MIVLDACVLIAHLDANDAHHDRATRMLARTEGLPGGQRAYGRRGTRRPYPAGRGRQAQEALDRLGVTALELPADVAAELAELRATTGLKMPDCCVLWTTVRQQPATLATFDQQLTRAAERRGVPIHNGE